MVHGATETARIQAASAALFGGGALHELDVATLAAALREAGSVEVKPTDGDAVRRRPARRRPGSSKSKGEARRTIGEGGAYLNNERVTDPEQVPAEADLLGGSWLVLRRGKKNLAGVEVAR